MLRWIVLALVVVALTGLATFLSVYAPDSSETLAVPAVVVTTGPQPKVEVPEPLVYEFGTMPQLSTGQHTWEFKNRGQANLELWFLSSTCSCTVAKLKSENGEEQKKLIVKPGESTTIDLEWQTKTFHDEYSKGATIGTNDPYKPSVSINVHGKVHPPVIVYPEASVVFNQVSNEETMTARIAVFSMDRPEMKIKKLTTSRPEFLVPHFRPLNADECKQLKVKAGFQVNVMMKPGMPLGRFRDELGIETDHPLKSEVKVPISGVTTGPISVIPERVRMANVSSSQGATKEMTLLVRGGTPTTFTVVKHPEKIQVEIVLDDKTQKGRYKMTVIVPPRTSAGPVDGEIVLKTDHPKAAEMKIPVSILISNSGAA